MRGIDAYKKIEQVISSPRDSEAKVILAVTKGLERYASEGVKSSSLKDYLVKNQRLWVAVRNETASSENTLPQDLRAKLISLSMWVERHTVSVLVGDGEVKDLIDVNKNIIAGLTGNSGNAEAEAVA